MPKRKNQTKNSSGEMFQSVWIEFSDGTKAGYIGQAKVMPGNNLTIVDISFTKPKPLPVGCSFGEIN